MAAATASLPEAWYGDSADGASHVERLNQDVDEIMAGLERGDISHVRDAAELMRRWELKGWRRVWSPRRAWRTAPGGQDRLLNKPTFPTCLR